jgi:hypothetical protein
MLLPQTCKLINVLPTTTFFPSCNDFMTEQAPYHKMRKTQTLLLSRAFRPTTGLTRIFNEPGTTNEN